MKRSANPWLAAATVLFALVLLMLASAHPAVAQVNVQVTATGTVTVSPGTSISNAGSFTATNNGTGSVTVTSVTIELSNPGAFSSISLSATAGGTSQTANFSSLATDNTASFSLPALTPGAQAIFTLSAQVSSNPTTSMAAPGGAFGQEPVIYAAMAGSPAQTPRSAWILILLALGFAAAGGVFMRVRRRWSAHGERPSAIFGRGAAQSARRRWAGALLFIVLIAAVSEIGCGDRTIFGTSSGGSGTTSSTQSVTALGVSTGSVGNLPATLGTITIQ